MLYHYGRHLFVNTTTLSGYLFELRFVTRLPDLACKATKNDVSRRLPVPGIPSSWNGVKIELCWVIDTFLPDQ